MTTKSTTEKPAKKLPSIRKCRELRRKMNLSQSEFWNRIGVTQSGGSRYEAMRKVPKTTQTVIDLTYGPLNAAVERLAAMRGITVAELLASQARNKKSHRG